MSQVTGVSSTFAGLYPSSIKDTTASMVASRQRHSQARNAADSIRESMDGAKSSAAVPESASARAKGHMHINVTV